MTLPRATSDYFQERKGVLAVAQQLNSAGLLWRETPNGDVGVDGQIEYVNEEGECTGHLVAAQIKSGPSFIKRSGEEILFYPNSKHVEYWARFPLPVLLFLHDPGPTTTYWIDARQWLRTGKGSPIRVPANQTLATAQKRQLFETVAPLGALMTTDGMVRHLAATVNKSPGFNVGFLDLFALGLTDMCRKLFFSMGLVMEIAEHRAWKARTNWTVGSYEHQFLDAYIGWLVEQNIARIDFADYLYDRDQLNLAPLIIAPLTERGFELRNALLRLDNSRSCVHEALIVIADESRFALSDRLDQLSALRQRVIEMG